MAETEIQYPLVNMHEKANTEQTSYEPTYNAFWQFLFAFLHPILGSSFHDGFTVSRSGDNNNSNVSHRRC